MCPICHKHAGKRADNAFFPFCSVRCKTIDLGKWLNEEYRVPVDASADEAEELASLLTSEASREEPAA